MSEGLNEVYEAIDREHADKSAATRRQLVAGAAATVGGMGLLSFPGVASAMSRGDAKANQPQTILNVAATAEVLATIVNTVGAEANLFGSDAVTQRNIKAAAREELVHYQVLTSSGVGGKELTKKIWVPDSVFASPANLLNTLEVGDQIFVNAYLIGVYAFGLRRQAQLANITAQFMGVEAVHRALARQSLGKLGNDRVFMKANNTETADAINKDTKGFNRIEGAVTQLQAAGFGFDAKGAEPGKYYEFDEVSKRTPTDPDLNTFAPDTI